MFYEDLFTYLSIALNDFFFYIDIMVVSPLIFILSLISFLTVIVGLVFYFRSSHKPTHEKIGFGIILLIFIYILYKRVFYFIDFSRYFIYDTELLAYFGIMAWVLLRHKGKVYPLSTKFVIAGIVLLAIVFISFYSVIFIEKYFHLCGITTPCHP